MKHLKRFSEINEGVIHKATKKPHEKKVWDTDKKEAFRKKVKDQIKSQGCNTKQVGNDLEVHLNKEHIAQVMFRDDYVAVKKEGSKFPKEFKYEELGKIKSELSDIIKSCK